MHAISRIFLKTLAVLAITLALSVQAQTAKKPSTIPFLDTVYLLNWEADADHGWAAAWLPEGDDLPDYTNMLRVEHTTNQSVTEAVQAQLQFLKQMEESSSNAGARILDLTENPNTREVVLVFQTVIIENEIARWKWSAYRYMPIQTANGKQEGVRQFDHSRQYIGNDKEGIERFLEESNDKQAERINALTHLQIP